MQWTYQEASFWIVLPGKKNLGIVQNQTFLVLMSRNRVSWLMSCIDIGLGIKFMCRKDSELVLEYKL